MSKHKHKGFILGLLLLLIIGLKLIDWSVGGIFTMFKSDNKIAVIDSSGNNYDTLFSSIDKGLDNLLIERGLAKNYKDLIKLKKNIAVSNPKVKLSSDSIHNPNFNTNSNETEFYLICNSGFIANTRGAILFILPGGSTSRYYYNISLKKGVYQYQTVSEPRDSVTFAVDETGAYKIGFQELHPSFTIYKDSLK